MSNLKDTDFDDLFRRASEKFPLRTDSSDWDKMAAALEKDPSPTPDDSNESGDRRKRRVFWLFLLLPLAGIGYITWHAAGRTGGHQESKAVVAKAANDNSGANTGTSGNAATGAKAGNDNSGANTGTSANAATGAKAGNDNSGAKAATTPAVSPASATGGAATASDNKVTTTGKTANTDKATVTNKTATTDNAGTTTGSATTAKAGTNAKTGMTVNAATGAKTGTTVKAATGAKVPAVATRTPVGAETTTSEAKSPANNGTSGKRVAQNNKPGGANGLRSGKRKRPGEEAGQRFGDENATIDPATNPIAAAFTLRQANIDAQRARIANPYAVTVVVTAPETAKEPTKETSGDAPKPKASPKQKTSYLYAGVIVAPDLSTVKMQRTTGVGNTFGVLLGYAFGPHWAVETGAYVERKRYYTDGEYFDTKKVNLPRSVDLLNVDGTCYMWEIPINIRYNFNPGGKTQWFATAGLSTYLMNRENYTYKYSYWGTRTWDSTWNIKKNSQYPFSIIGLSAGFEQRLGKLGNLRVEPYVRIPLGGIGTGSLPIMSTGINIGFTRRLW